MADPTNLVTIASEQLWPQLLGLNCLHALEGGVKSLHILHSADASRSREPGTRLQRLARIIEPRMPVSLHLTGTSPKEVCDAIGRIISLAPQDTWSLNCTGGTKLMFAGFLPIIASGRVRAFYREMTGDWYRLHCSAETNMTLIADPWPEVAASKLQLPAKTLVEAQGEIPRGATWSESEIQTLDAPELVRAGIALDWNWRAMADRFPTLPTKAGFAFELLVVALIRALGCDNISLNLTLSSNSTTLQEFDVVVSTGGNLVLFDLKLSTEDSRPPIDQIMRLASNRTALGGLGGRAVAIRPSWAPTPELERMAAALSVELWTSAEAWQMIPRLARVLGVAPGSFSTEVQDIDSLLQGEHARGRRVFTYERAPRIQGDPSHIEEAVGILNLTNYFTSELVSRDKPVLVADYGPWLVVCGRTDYCNWGDERALATEFSGMCTVMHHARTRNGNLFIAICLPAADKARTLIRQRLIPSRRGDEHDLKWQSLKQELDKQREAQSRSAPRGRRPQPKHHGKRHNP